MPGPFRLRTNMTKGPGDEVVELGVLEYTDGILRHKVD